jgi:hypothetical protein
MIHELDESLRALVTREALNGSGVEVTFDAPTKEWAARRNAPTLNIYLYDIREDVERRQVEFQEVHDEKGRVVERRAPPRRFKLSYLITAWTQRPEDEHRLLGAVLGCVLRNDSLPRDVLAGSLAEQPLALITNICLPPPEDRNLSDVWSALGGELKPSLDLVVSMPYDARRTEESAPPVLEEPRIRLVADEREESRGRSKGSRGRATAEPEEAAVPEETIVAGDEAEPGRTVTVRGTVPRS